MSKILLEVCCGGIEDVLTAAHCGADRVEFCQALPLGGLTPSFGTFLTAREHTAIPMMVMIRPRAGAFCYSEHEFEGMLKDTALFVNSGAEGIVCGCLTPEGLIDLERGRRLREAAGAATLVFHRAFDVCAQPWQALEQLISLGFDRILTSGRAATAPNGAEFLRELHARAAGRIELVAGAGIHAGNALELLASTGLRQLHLSASSLREDPSANHNPAIHFGTEDGQSGTYPATDPVKLQAIIEQVKGAIYV